MADNSTKIVITAEDRATQALKSVEKSFDGLVAGGAKLAGAFTALTGLSFGGFAASLGAMVKSTTEAQDSMLKMSQKAGMSVESLSGLGYAAKLAGADTEALVKASKTLSQNIVEAGRNSDATKTVFGSMGIAVKDAAGNLRATDQVLLDVAGKFAGMEDGANKSALAVKLFGKQGLDLIPFLNQGKDGIEGLRKEAEKLGIVISTDAAQSSEKFNDNLERLSMASEGLKRSIGNAALPLLNEFVQQLTDAKLAGGGLAQELRDLFTRANIEAWAKDGANALAWVYDSAKGVATVVKDIGGAFGAMGAAVVAVLEGNFAKAQAINEQWQQDSLKLYDYEQMRDKVANWFSEYQRTVRVNGEKFVLENEAQAKQVQKIYDDMYAKMGQKSKGYVEFDEAQLKKQEAVRVKYAEEEKKRLLGDVDYAKSKVREKYEAELALIRGSTDEAKLAAEIRKKMEDELAGINSATVQKRIEGETAVLDTARKMATERVTVERAAADQVTALWDQANAAKSGATGGDIANRGTAGEFVSSWQGNKYVGDLGSPVSSPGALGHAYSSGGRKLSIEEEIAMRNGFARFATGGSFMVGGSGGTDSQLVAFKASPNERVTIETPEQQRAGSPVININGSNLSATQIIAAIRQALRTDPNLLSPGFARAG